MGKGKSVRIIIPDGEPHNAIEITMPSWDGIAFRIKREYLQTAKDISALKQCGVYFLYGEKKTSDGIYSQKVYIGQGVLRQNGEGVFWRIKEHDVPAEEYWTEAIAFVDNKNEWGKTEISYIENRFANSVLNAKKHHKNYEVVNGNNPNPGNVTKAKQWELDDYIEGAELILQILGYDFFVKEKSSISEELSLITTKSVGVNIVKSTESNALMKKCPEADITFPFKIGKVMSCAFRNALETGLLKDQMQFLMSEDACTLFKTKGNLVVVSGEKPCKDSSGRNRFAKDPVLFQGEKYWITTQVWANGLENLLSFLEQYGMSRKKIEEICLNSESLSPKKHKEKSHIIFPKESFRDYLKKTMCKNSALSYASAFRALEDKLIQDAIIAAPLSNDIERQKLEEIKNYISSDQRFLAYNKYHHYSRSAAFRKFLEYLYSCDNSGLVRHG